MRHAIKDVMITVTTDVILITFMGDGTMKVPVLMLLAYRLYLQIMFTDRHID